MVFRKEHGKEAHFFGYTGVRHGSRFDTRVSCGSPQDLYKASLLLLYRVGFDHLFPIQSSLDLDVVILCKNLLRVSRIEFSAIEVPSITQYFLENALWLWCHLSM